MKHIMRLNNEPFESIKNGTKTIELRLYDDKRRLLNIGDTIEFINRINEDTILTKVIKLHIYKNFRELYNYFNKISLGYKESEEKNPDDMYKYYSEEEQNKYGVVGIEIKLIK